MKFLKNALAAATFLVFAGIVLMFIFGSPGCGHQQPFTVTVDNRAADVPARALSLCEGGDSLACFVADGPVETGGGLQLVNGLISRSLPGDETDQVQYLLGDTKVDLVEPLLGKTFTTTVCTAATVFLDETGGMLVSADQWRLEFHPRDKAVMQRFRKLAEEGATDCGVQSWSFNRYSGPESEFELRVWRREH